MVKRVIRSAKKHGSVSRAVVRRAVKKVLSDRRVSKAAKVAAGKSLASR